MEHLRIGRPIARSHFVSTEEEAVRVAANQISSNLCGFRTPDDILGDLIPGDVKIYMTEIGIAQDLFDIPGVIFYWTNDPAHSRMRPDDSRIRRAFENGFRLVEIRRLRSFFCKRNVHIVMD